MTSQPLAGTPLVSGVKLTRMTEQIKLGTEQIKLGDESAPLKWASKVMSDRERVTVND